LIEKPRQKIGREPSVTVIPDAGLVLPVIPEDNPDDWEE